MALCVLPPAVLHQNDWDAGHWLDPDSESMKCVYPLSGFTERESSTSTFQKEVGLVVQGAA
eukprot:214678-Pelagomonas_calceolata.AAC.1